MDIYGKIYDIVSTNMSDAGLLFEYNKETFLCDVGKHPQVVDVSKYLELGNEMFFQAIFVAAYRRLPEEKEISGWSADFQLPREDFQRKVLRKISNSTVIAINHVHIENNPYFRQNKGIKYRAFGALYGLTDKSSLRELGKKMPQAIQKVIRKVFL